ncbi:RNA polymerase sigma factor (sigma-70 family) [Nocardiopsis sp. Huas11]|uniref:sigma-70 family RNA polymerase sigma factor n=1 Tax=Nocardiopsis sp. Huas11 TaxID=2183912 RepID=UPI000EAE2962|nr:sigma-70 family RNA polymerase sigma factor [Nocardiopsis sp. Huas11]RKS09877.1 RNA polymerase sigma factor (sigma-70 family) [Nocardiopsis sp. Huas11]
MTDVHRTVDAVWKLESARIIAALTRVVRDVGTAEELAQDALVAALQQWPATGVPDNPGAWLTTTAKRRAVDHIRRARSLERKHEQIAHELERTPESGLEADPGAGAEAESDRHDVLRLLFVTCHPVLSPAERVALTLRLVAGLSTREIARAFLTGEQRVAQRVADAKRTLAARGVAFDLPDAADLAERLTSVLGVVYLVFNEGYSATAGDDLMRPSLCLDALRLGRTLAVQLPDQAEVHGLVALMELQQSRAAARTGPSGELLQLHEQNRGRWDLLLVRRGFAAMLRARDLGGPPGPYVLQAAIAVCHAQARTAKDTDWDRIATLYDRLVERLPTPVVRLNRAVAVGRARGPREGLDLTDELVADPALRDYHLLPGVRGDLLLRLGRSSEAAREFERAAALTDNAAERAFLLRRADEATAGAAVPGPTLAGAAREFLERDGLGAATARSYGQTLRRLCRALGERLPLEELDAAAVARVFAATWPTAAARTWNRHRAAVRSFGAWAGLDDLAAGLERRAEPTAPPRAVEPDHWAPLWSDGGAPLRERTLWRLLHESGAPVTTVLALDVQDLDLEERRALVRGTWVSWRAGTARLLPHVVAGRDRGPLFLADRRPGPGRRPAEADLCPSTGRSRLSYPRAEYLFKQATRRLDPAGRGYTLSRLRPRRPAGRVSRGDRPTG